jgi:endonuclease III
MVGMKRNFVKVFKIFSKNYITVPLEVYAGDPYKTLVSTLLSSRTRDETTLAATQRLFKKAEDIQSLAQLSLSEIRKLIYPVGFYKTKAIHLNKLANKVVVEYKGKIPENREGLMKLPGVGRKTANLVLNRAFNIPAVAVDTHVHRITNMLGWVDSKNPEQTEKQLIQILPKKYWPDTNRLFVSIGRQYLSKQQLENFLKNNKLVL